MNAVIALTDLLLQERSSLNDEQIEHLDVIQTSGHHLLTVSTTWGLTGLERVGLTGVTFYACCYSGDQ
jgi:hypothetical protein